MLYNNVMGLKRRQNFQEVLGPEFFQPTLGEIAKGIRQKRIVVVMSFPGSPSYRQWLYLVEDEEAQKKFLEGQEFEWLRVDLEMLKELSVDELEQKIKEKLQIQSDLEDGLRKRFEQKRKPVVLGLFGGERVIEEGEFEVVKWVDVVRRLDLMRVVWFFETNLLGDEFLEVVKQVPTFQFKLVPIPVYEDWVGERFEEFLEDEEEVKLEKKLKEQVIELSKGMLVLLKAMIFIIKDWQEEEIDKIKVRPTMKLVLGEVWRGFGVREREVMTAISLKRKLKWREWSAEIDYLKTMRLIEKKDDDWRLRIPLLEWYIHQLEGGERELRFEEDGRVMLDGMEVGRNFSKRERELLGLLVVRKGEVVSREEIGERLWGEEGYSDWALDAVVSRLRKKLAKLGLETRLKTKKKLGVVYGGD